MAWLDFSANPMLETSVEDQESVEGVEEVQERDRPKSVKGAR